MDCDNQPRDCARRVTPRGRGACGALCVDHVCVSQKCTGGGTTTTVRATTTSSAAVVSAVGGVGRRGITVAATPEAERGAGGPSLCALPSSPNCPTRPGRTPLAPFRACGLASGQCVPRCMAEMAHAEPLARIAGKIAARTIAGAQKQVRALALSCSMAPAPAPPAPAPQQTAHNTHTHTMARCSLAHQSERDRVWSGFVCGSKPYSYHAHHAHFMHMHMHIPIL